MRKHVWPPWWSWELKKSSHVEERMLGRGFTEIDLRTMLEVAATYRRDVIEGRWIIETWHEREAWEVVVEPDFDTVRLVVVTAYPVWEP